MRIAIVGTGIAGLTCAHLLRRHHDVVVFEAEGRPGGHTHTVRVDLGDETHDVDTGFIVYNERNYPGLTRLFAELGVVSKPSDMSFSVSDERTGVQWRGTSAATVFAQPRNLVRPAFLAMLRDVARFSRSARRLLEAPGPPAGTLGAFLARQRWSPGFLDWYLIPMAAAIWSAAPDDVMAMPAATFARFFDNHGLLRLGDQPAWRTVDGGAATYVRAVLGPLGDRVRLATPVAKVVRRPDGVEVVTDRHGPETFDHVVVATHSDQALALLSDADRVERAVLGAIGYRPNRAVLHTDDRLLPRSPRARASWNYRRPVDGGSAPTVTYDLNRLQSIRSDHQLCVTLNQEEAVDPAKVLRTMDYAHPVFDTAAVAAQARHHEIDGRRRTSFCGAYWGYGFHEDGVESARRVCRKLGVDW